jgi:hypothetical protein
MRLYIHYPRSVSKLAKQELTGFPPACAWAKAPWKGMIARKRAAMAEILILNWVEVDESMGVCVAL